MGFFADDFERANGAPGNGWVDLNGVSGITNGALAYSGVVGISYNTNTYDANRHDCSITASGVGSGGQRAGCIVRTGAGGHGFTLTITGTSRPYTLSLFASTAMTGTPIASATLDIILPPMYTLRLTWEAGHLVGYYNGTQMLTADSALWFNDRYCGLTCYTTLAPIQSFQATAGAAVQFTVTPNPCGNYGSPVAMSAAGTGTAWTPGTPGSPLFTVDHGSISGQIVSSTTAATFTYDPGSFLGTATFRDPSTGEICAVIVTSSPLLVPPVPVFLTPTAIDYIERSAIADAANLISNRGMNVAQTGDPVSMSEALGNTYLAVTDSSYSNGPNPGVNRAAMYIWQMLNGLHPAPTGLGPTPTNTTIKGDLESILAALDTMATSNHWTLGDTITQITGLGVPTIKDVMDRLADLSSPDLGPLSAKLDAMRGDTTTSLYTLLSSIAGIRTLGAYSLGDVREWIGTPAQAKPDATAVAVGLLLLALLAAPVTGGASVAVLAAAEGAGPVLDVATLVELVSVAGELAGIAADIAELRRAPTSSYLGAPVWPGAANVDLGTSVALGSRGTITEPMDGVLVVIDHADTDHKPAYNYDGRKAWRNVGGLAFASGDGYLDTYQALGFEQQMFTPKTLYRAASVSWFTTHGPIGTIRAWRAKP